MVFRGGCWHGSVRLSKLRAAYLRRRAMQECWQTGDFTRALIVLGMVIYFLRLRNREALEGFLRLATLHRASTALDMAVGRGRGRRNEPKRAGGTTLVPLHLPRGFYELVSTYSCATGTSRNALMSRFLEIGYVLYMLGQETLRKTLRSLQEERGIMSGAAETRELMDRRTSPRSASESRESCSAMPC